LQSGWLETYIGCVILHLLLVCQAADLFYFKWRSHAFAMQPLKTKTM